MKMLMRLSLILEDFTIRVKDLHLECGWIRQKIYNDDYYLSRLYNRTVQSSANLTVFERVNVGQAFFLLMKVFLGLLAGLAPLTMSTWISPASAEGGCPEGLFPIGGGYCRNIVCTNPNGVRDGDTAVATLKKYKKECPYYVGNPAWGNLIVPKR